MVAISCSKKAGEGIEIPAEVTDAFSEGGTAQQPRAQQPTSQPKKPILVETPVEDAIESPVVPDTVAPLIDPIQPFAANAAREISVQVADKSPLVFGWEKISGPGNVMFDPVQASNSRISADADGSYEIKFTATDSGGLTSSSTVTFLWDTVLPLVTVGTDVSGPESTTSKTGTASDLNPIVLAWSRTSGPDIVTLDATDQLSMTAQFSGDGIVTIRLSATDSAGNVGSDEFSVNRNSAAAQISAGPDLFVDAEANLAATVDDGTQVTYQWSQVSGPGTTVFGSPTSLMTTALPNQDGVYVLRIMTSKLGITSHDDLTLAFDTAAPQVNVGSNQSKRVPFLVSPTVTDLSPLIYQWSQISGPGTVSFSSPSAANTTISADLEGTYTIRLNVVDSLGHAQMDEFDLSWDATPPVVNIGSDLANVTVTATINATTSDASALTYQWSKISGPGSIIFGSATAEDTTARTTTPGIYVLRLTATDAKGNTAFDELNFDWTKFTQSWNFSNLANYSYDPTKVGFLSGTASLLPVDAIELIDTQAEFTSSGYAYAGVEWSGADSALQLSAAGLASQTGTYTSPVLDFGASLEVNRLSWGNTIPGPFQRDLPSNGMGDPAEWGPDAIQNMSDLVLLYHFNDDAGSTTLIDSSENLKADGTAMMTSCGATECPLLNYRGRIGRGVEFDGSNDYMTIADDPTNRIDGDMSISLWMKVDNNDFNYIIEKGNSDACDNYAFLIYNKRAMFEFSKGMGAVDTCGGNWAGWEETAGQMSTGVWYHLAVVYNHTSGDVTFYRNGVVSGQYLGVPERIKPSNQNVYIGRQWWGGGTANAGFFDGGLDELAVFRRQLTSAEIQKMYKRGLYRLDLQVRACSDATCSTNPVWVGPDGGTGSRFYTYFKQDGSVIDDLPILGVASTRYLQYQATFNSPDTIISPKLNSVGISTVSQGNPTVQLVVSAKPYTSLATFSEVVESDHVGDVKYQLSPNGSDWYYFTGGAWTATSGGFSESNFASTINANAASFTSVTGTGSLYFRAYLNKNPGSGFIRLRGVTVTGTQAN
jgi:hypothetical protein